MKGEKSEERRKFTRIRAKCPLKYKMKRGDFYASALTEDISLCGARIDTDRTFPIGLKLKLGLNILSEIINPIGRVVWSKQLADSDEYCMGIEFIQIEGLEKDHLSDYIDRHLSESTVEMEK